MSWVNGANSVLSPCRDEGDADVFVGLAVKLNAESKLVHNLNSVIRHVTCSMIHVTCMSHACHMQHATISHVHVESRHCVCLQVEIVDEKLMRQFCSSALGTLPPLATAIGGVVAQEALISLTGKFTPLRQWVSQLVPMLVVVM